MSRFSCVFAFAPLMVLAGCDDAGLLESNLSPLTIDMALSRDSLLPHESAQPTVVIRNHRTSAVTLTGGGCLVGFDLFDPNGVPISQPSDGFVRGDGVDWGAPGACATILVTRTIPGRDSLVLAPAGEGSDDPWVAPSFSIGELAPGTYSVRPYFRGNGYSAEGPKTVVNLRPWTRARLLQSYADLAALDLVVGGQVAASGVGAGFVAGGGIVPAGTQTVELRIKGESTPIATSVMALSEDSVHTFAVREVAGGGVEPWDLIDTPVAVAPDETSLRVVHLAADAVAIDVYVSPPGDLAGKSAGFSYGTASPYVTGTVGTWRVVVSPAGRTDTLLIAVLPLNAGQIRTWVLMDDGAGGLVAALIEP